MDLITRIERIERALQARQNQGFWFQNNTVLIHLCWHLNDINGDKPLTNAQFEQLSGLREKWPLPPSEDDRITGYFANYAQQVAQAHDTDVWTLYTALHADDNAADYLELSNGFNEPHKLERGKNLGITDNELVYLWYCARCYLSIEQKNERNLKNVSG